MGGGEPAYKQALIRLKEECGRRDVMRAAISQAIERLVPGKGPTCLKIFAEKLRTHDLNRLGATNDEDLIQKTLTKLYLPERLAWSERTTTRREPANLNEFATWLCTRARAYLSAYDIAEYQSRSEFSNDQRSNPKTQGRTYQVNSSDTDVNGTFQFCQIR